MKPFLVTSGEPAGVGPDICLSLINSDSQVVVLADIDMLYERAAILGIDLSINEYVVDQEIISKNCLHVLHVPCKKKVSPGKLNSLNAPYVIEQLNIAAQRTSTGEFAGLITAPVHKGIINAAGINFTGHTEFFANYFGVDKVVMMLASPTLRVALVTTHIPIKNVAEVITQDLLIKIIKIIHKSLQQNYSISSPKIYIAGLNPHAGENGYIGREEIDTIIPALEKLRSEGMRLTGPLSADTMFSKANIAEADVFLTMYHDQGLPVLKYSGFSDSVNITLGLPIIRTSVDHGTALELAGSGKVNAKSLHNAISEAILISSKKINQKK